MCLRGFGDGCAWGVFMAAYIWSSISVVLGLSFLSFICLKHSRAKIGKFDLRQSNSAFDPLGYLTYDPTTLHPRKPPPSTTLLASVQELLSLSVLPSSFPSFLPLPRSHPPLSLPPTKMCITLGYTLYKKSQAKKSAAAGDTGGAEKDEAPRPHTARAGGPQAHSGPPSYVQSPRGGDGVERGVVRG